MLLARRYSCYVPRMESPDAVSSAATTHRHFKDRPTQVFIDYVKAHIAQTGQPETCEGLYRDRISKDEPFLILAEIEVNLNARPEGDLAPCPMCHAANKFRDGRLVFLHQLGAVAVIGHECASHETNQEANREWRLREQRRIEEDFLLRKLPTLPQRLTRISEAEPTCSEADDFLRAFRSDGKLFFEPLRKARSTGGHLVVTEEIRSSGTGPRGIRSAGSGIETRDHTVGVLRGQTAVARSFNPRGSLEAVLQALNRHRCSNEEAVMEYITSMPDLGRSTVVRELRKAERNFADLLKKLEDFVLFFGDRNLSTINAWAGHDFSSFKFEVSLGSEQSDGRRRFEARANGGYFQHLVGPALWTDLSRLSVAEDD